MTRIVMPSVVKQTVRYVCRICERPFFEGQERLYQDHVVACCDENAGELHEQLMSTKLPGFYGADREAFELEQWTAKHKAAILEGKKRM